MTDEIPVVSLSDEYHTAIGQITVNAALMDQLIDSAIWVVMRLPPERGIIVTKLIANTSRKIKFLSELVKPMLKEKTVRNDFHDVYCKLRSAQKNRSKIVHARWVFSHPDQKIHIEVPLSDETQAVVEPMPLKQLRRYRDEIATAHKALEDFFRKVELKPDKTGSHVWPPRFEERKFRRKK